MVFVVLQGRFRSTVAEELQGGKETLDLATRVAWCLEVRTSAKICYDSLWNTYSNAAGRAIDADSSESSL